MEQEMPETSEERRGLLEKASRWGLAIGLTTAYGTFAAFLARFLMPSSKPAVGWLYVTPTGKMTVGDSLLFKTPKGATVNIARQADGDEEGAFIALSSTCPHLGCQVFWEAQNDRFFCPCHNGIFSSDGVGIGGPPGDAGQDLPRYPIKVDSGLLFLEVASEEIAMGPGEILQGPDSLRAEGLQAQAPPGPGHDPCLFPGTQNPPVCRLRGA